MSGQDFAEEIPEIGGHREVAILVAVLRIEPRPLPRYPPTSNRPAQREHGGGMPVVGPAGTILPDGSSELGHRQHAYFAHPFPEIRGEG